MSWNRSGLPLLILIGLVALGAALGMQKIRTFDYWWHLRTGELIVETVDVPTEDPYSYTVPGNRWIDVHWLFQVGLHGVHRVGGHEAVVAAKVVGIWLLLGILASMSWRRESAVLTALPLGLMLLIASDRFMPRPELPSFILLAAVLALLDRHERRGGLALWWIVPLQLVWVNVHGLFALGIAVCAIACAAEGIRPLVAPGERFRRDHALRLAAVTVASLLVSLVNPNGLDGVLYPIQQLGMVGPTEDRGLFGSLIAELIPPLGGEHGLDPFGLALFTGLGVLSFGAMAANWRRVSAFDLLAWVAFLYLGLGARRNLALFAIVAAPIAARNLSALLALRPAPPRWLPALGLLVAAGLGAATFSAATDRFFPGVSSFREAGVGIQDFYYPVGAAEWLARENPPGPVCHHMADGGYLIWRLWPEKKVMTDGRLEVYGAETFAKLQVGGVDRFRELDEQYRFGSVLLHYSLIDTQDLGRWLDLNPNWRLVHVDDTTMLFVRDDPASEQRYQRVDLDDPALFSPLAGEPSLRDQMRRQARVNLFTVLHRFDRALALWEETLELYPDLGQGPVIHAYLLQRNGFASAAETILREELARRPDDAKLYAQVGDLRREAGDLDAAAEMYDAALELDPDHRYASLRRALLLEERGDLEQAAYEYSRLMATAASPADPIAAIATSRLRALGAL